MRILSILVVALLLAAPAHAWQVIGCGVEQSGCAGGSDGQIGYATLGGDVSDGGSNLIYYSYFTPTENGTVTYAHAWKKYASGSYQIGIFSATGTLLASTGSQTGGDDPIAEVHAAVESYCLVTGTTYILGFWRPDAWITPGTSGHLGTGHNVYSQTLSTFGDFTPSDTIRVSDRDITITLNNSADTF